MSALINGAIIFASVLSIIYRSKLLFALSVFFGTTILTKHLMNRLLTKPQHSYSYEDFKPVHIDTTQEIEEEI